MLPLEPIGTPVEMEALDGQGGEGDQPLEKVQWGWGCEGVRKGGPWRGWFGKAESMKLKEGEKKEKGRGTRVGKRLKEQEKVNSFRQMFIKDIYIWQDDGKVLGKMTVVYEDTQARVCVCMCVCTCVMVCEVCLICVVCLWN